MKTFSESSREHEMETFNFLKMKLLTKQQQKSNENEKIYYICQEKFEDGHAKDKKHCEIRVYCHYTGEYREAASSICNLMYSTHKEIYMVFHNGYNYNIILS